MQFMRLVGSICTVALAAVCLAQFAPHPAKSADLQDSSTLVSHPQADINDVYLFPGKTSGNVVLVMDVDPLIAHGSGGAASFDPSVLYQFKIVHSASAHTASSRSGSETTPEDTVIQFLYNNGSVTMYGPGAPNQTGISSTIMTALASQKIPVNTPTTLMVPDFGSGKTGTQAVQVFAGARTDPSFFDLARFYSIFPDRYYQNDTTGIVPAATATSFRGFSGGSTCNTSQAYDFFSTGGADLVAHPTGGYNTLSIVVEMPATMLEEVPQQSSLLPYVNLWATTSTVSGV